MLTTGGLAGSVAALVLLAKAQVLFIERAILLARRMSPVGVVCT